MATQVKRPLFYEGQILAASDLSMSLGYARDQDARHERYLHTWGIAEGLQIVEANDGFVLQPGFAIDSSGAPIIVDRTVPIDRDQFRLEANITVSDTEGRFPVFISRTEEEATNGQQIGQCSSGAATRKVEGYLVRYRRIVTGWDENQDTVSVEAGPDDQPGERVVLLGFLEWKEGEIVGFERRNLDGVGPRYAGVRADDVLGRGGSLTLRTRPAKTQDAPMTVVDHHNDKKTFVWGLDDGQGRINEVLSVDAKGNLKARGNIEAAGSLTGSIQTGDVSLESGFASDGTVLPLPAHIREEQILDGSVVLNIIVTPRIDWSQNPSGGWGPFVYECRVDDQRRLHCITRWLKFDGSGFITQLDFPGAADYQISATVLATGETS